MSTHEHCHDEHCHHDAHHDGRHDAAHEGHPISRYEEAFGQFDLHLHDEQIAAEAARLVEENKAKYNTEEVKRQLLGTLELTTLKVTDSQESVLQLVEKVNAFADAHPDLPTPATLCVYPNFARIVADSLEADHTEIACVSGGFPSSQTFIEVKTAETALAVHDGATEIDMVLSVGAFLSGDYESCADEITEIKAVCNEHPLKVILETGALQTAANIKRAAILAIYAGADFIKTSTGKIEPAATPEAAYVMCRTLREYYQLTGTKIGFKAAGGISSVDDALTYYTIVREVLGEEWIKEGLFRIGTSRLANLLVSDLLGETVKPF